METIQFQTKSFDALTVTELHNIYKLRAEIFVVEQQCAYQDVDDKDLKALHLLMLENGELIGYCRLLPGGVSYPEAAIGRVGVVQARRKQSLGKKLMRRAVETTLSEFQVSEILISAQCYLEVFYKNLGFTAEGEKYLEDDIPHIRMRYQGK